MVLQPIRVDLARPTILRIHHWPDRRGGKSSEPLGQEDLVQALGPSANPRAPSGVTNGSR